MQVAYSEFLSLVNSGNVKAAGIDDSADKIYFSLNGHSSQQAAEAAAAAAVEAAPSSQAEASTSAPTSGEWFKSWPKRLSRCRQHNGQCMRI